MKFKVGDILYEGESNGVFYSFIKGKVVKVTKIYSIEYYKIKVLEDYGSIWDAIISEVAVPGTVEECSENAAYATFKEAKTAVYKDMHFKSDREFIANYLNQ